MINSLIVAFLPMNWGRRCSRSDTALEKAPHDGGRKARRLNLSTTLPADTAGSRL